MWKRLLRPGIVLVIAALAVGVAVLLGWAGVGGQVGSQAAGARVDDFFYDAFYRMRPQQPMQQSDVVLVAVDDRTLQELNVDWPLPRVYWGEVCKYLDRAGAKVI